MNRNLLNGIIYYVVYIPNKSSLSKMMRLQKLIKNIPLKAVRKKMQCVESKYAKEERINLWLTDTVTSKATVRGKHISM